MTRLLRVVAPHFVAGAMFAWTGVGWRCVEAAPIIRWMEGREVGEIYLYVTRKGWGWDA